MKKWKIIFKLVSAAFVATQISFILLTITFKNLHLTITIGFTLLSVSLFGILLLLCDRINRNYRKRLLQIGNTLNEEASDLVKFNLKLSNQLNVPVYEDSEKDFTTFTVEEKLVFLKKVIFACLQNLETIHFEKKEEGTEALLKKENKGNLSAALPFYKASVNELLKSIIENISSTTVPISVELLNIKDNISKFLKDIHNDKDEIKGQNAFSKIVGKYEKVSEDFSQFVSETTESYGQISESFLDMTKMIDKIFQTCKQIDDIAERVNVLSINAAIEAARSGDQGKGFAVIAREIKTLSESTKNFVKEIGNLIQDSDTTLSQMSEKFKDSSAKVIQKIETEKVEFGSFYHLLTKNYEKFNKIFHIIQEMVDQVSESVKKVNPIVQLHEITVQEMENLSLIMEDFFKEEIGDNLIDCSPSVIEQTAYQIRKHLTTSRELDALSAACNVVGVNEEIDLKSDTKEIEFF